MKKRHFQIKRAIYRHGYGFIVDGWALYLNGEVVLIRSTWEATMYYLIRHWYCECLEYLIEPRTITK